MKHIDKQLHEITTLKWLPWIGNQYTSIPKKHRLFIIGESHYHDKSAKSIERHNIQTFTREVIEDMAIGRNYYNTKIFQNIHKTLFGNDKFNSENFWNLVSFSNIIQRPMETNNGRPTYNDYYLGWLTFFETLKFIKPSSCIFVGVGASNSLKKAISNSTYSLKSFVKEEKISTTYPRKAIISTPNGDKINLIFIQHVSKYFSCSKWNIYLQKSMNNELTWLQENSKKLI